MASQELTKDVRLSSPARPPTRTTASQFSGATWDLTRDQSSVDTKKQNNHRTLINQSIQNMYSKQDMIQFGTYLLSEARAKRLEVMLPHNDQFAAKSREVSEDDFLGAFPNETIILTAQDFVNDPELANVVDEANVPLQVGDQIEIPSDPQHFVDPQN